MVNFREEEVTMKIYWLVVVAVMQCFSLKAQTTYEAGYRFGRVPDSVTYDGQSFANHLLFQYKTDEQRLYALYSWITSNIRYNSDSSYYYTFNGSQEEKVTAILRRRKGVCEQFATLLTEVSNLAGIRAYLVHGYAEAGAGSRNVAHSWCAIRLNNEWRLYDPTWDATRAQTGFRYFKVSPEEFIHTHIPFDPMWQLLEKPIGFKLSSNAEKFRYRDTIDAFLQADSLGRLLSIDRRMKRMVSQKELFKIWHAYNRMQIAIIGNEEDMKWYNAAVDDLNMATDYFNAFIEYRNNHFKPAKTEQQINAMLQQVALRIEEAHKKIQQIGKITENFQYDTGSLTQRLTSLNKRREEQMEFLKKYFSQAPDQREQLFYK